MRKFTKIALIFAAVFGIIGVGCLIAAASMGAFNREFLDSTEGKIAWFIKNDRKEETEVELIEDGGESLKDSESTDGVVRIREKVQSIDIELVSGVVEVFYDDVDCIQIEQNQVAGFKYSVDKDGELCVRSDIKLGVKNTEEKIVIRIPHGMSFSEFDLEAGAGIAKVDGILAREFSADVKTGEVNIMKLDSQIIDISVDAGSLSLGAAGNQEDYNYELECCMGKLQVGAQSYSGMSTTKSVENPSATRSLEVECGVGTVIIMFAE